jgi:hypothetical protein
MHDIRRREGGRSIRRALRRPDCSQRHDDKLQSDQCARERANDHVKTFPLVELWHRLLFEPIHAVRKFRAICSVISELSMSNAKGSVYRAMRKGPASTGSNPTSRIRPAATCVLRISSPQ